MNERVQPDAVSGSLAQDNPQEEFSSRSLLIGGALFLALLTVLYIIVQSIGIDELQTTVATAGIWGPLMFVGIKALTFTFAPLSAGPIQFASGIMFGVIPGTLYSLLGELLGGTINVIIARLFGRRIVRRFVGAAAMSRVDRFYERHLNDWKSLLAARVLLFSVYDFISYAVGFSQIRLSVYIVVSFVGGLFPTLLFVLIGSEASQHQNVLLLFYLLAAIAFFVLVLFRVPISRMIDQYGRRVHK
ncbi:MAG: VTT domain-containing protein [Chloroflexi bacterium]|nr:VTT domain-containing protein [Chloroflexota bacterium]